VCLLKVSRLNSHSGTDSKVPHVIYSIISFSFFVVQHDVPEQLKELETGWNKHHPKGPPRHERQHSHGPGHSPVPATNGHSRARTQSGDSIRSVEGNLSSRGTSASSHSDCRCHLSLQYLSIHIASQQIKNGCSNKKKNATPKGNMRGTGPKQHVRPQLGVSIRPQNALAN
jgi:hypothetical protein